MSFIDRMRTQKLLSFTLLLFTLCLGIVIGTLISTGVKAARDNNLAPGATSLAIPNPVELSNAFTQIAKQVEPSVVNISVTYPVRTSRRSSRRQAGPDDGENNGNNGGMDDFFRRFMNPFGGESPEMPGGEGKALGSGVVVDAAGYILTNNHVVDQSARLQVKFSGDTNEYDAKIVGTDKATDLAVIRVQGKRNLTPAKIGNSDAVQVGDWALAIGSPFGFDATVTAGIISAKERTMNDDSTMQFQHFLQTDAAINPGNSGGPLLNMRGEVVGINTAIASRTGGYQGIGFALPINTAAGVYNEIIKNGKVIRGSIGIKFAISDLPETVAAIKASGASEGVFVDEVEPGGPADKAKLREGDVIVAINGKAVHGGDSLVDTVTATPVGDSVNLTVLRDGKRENVKVVVGNMAQIFPETVGADETNPANKPQATSVSFGMTIVPLTDRLRESLDLKGNGGVRVQDVEPNSFADDLKLSPGDVILSIGFVQKGVPVTQEITSVDDLKRVQAMLKPGDSVKLRTMHRDNPRGGQWYSVYRAGVVPEVSR
ncbi:MAG TPA: Do family serine endopeptidase [Bryobacteraceae bacterium]|nr:Do family serine endopeptidase [Bryobacteraceae bacterium]